LLEDEAVFDGSADVLRGFDGGAMGLEGISAWWVLTSSGLIGFDELPIVADTIDPFLN